MCLKRTRDRAAKSGTIGYVLKSGRPPPERVERVNGSIVIAVVILAGIASYFLLHI